MKHPNMKAHDIRTLADWLGLEGAIAGLERSNFTNADLMMLAREIDVDVDSKASRRQIVIELVMSDVSRIDKRPDDLLGMNSDVLKRYFSDRLVSSRELFRYLKDFGISPPRKTRGKLLDFAAQEISELGMYQRVAQGKRESLPIEFVGKKIDKAS